jgi:hypothetical protein
MNAKPWMSPGLARAVDTAARLFIVLGLLSTARGFAAFRGANDYWLSIEGLVLVFALPLAWAGRRLRRAASRVNNPAAFETGLRAVAIAYACRGVVILAIAAIYLTMPR